MRDILSVFVFIVGAILAVYVGCYEMFIKGIVQLLNAIKETPINSLQVAIGIFKVLFSGTVGWLIFIISTFIARLIE